MDRSSIEDSLADAYATSEKQTTLSLVPWQILRLDPVIAHF